MLLSTQEWHNASGVAKAYSIGRGEASAVSQLLSGVSPAILERITESVRVRGMPRYLTHDAIARGLFSTAFTSGVGACEAWHDQLVNKHDNALESCFEGSGCWEGRWPMGPLVCRCFELLFFIWGHSIFVLFST